MKYMNGFTLKRTRYGINDPIGSFCNDFEQINMFLCLSGHFFEGFMKILLMCYLIMMLAVLGQFITIGTIYLLGRLAPFTF
jgi:hypothetical protein